MKVGILHADDSHSARIRNLPFVFCHFVTVPTQRFQVTQFKSKLRELFQRLYVMHFRCLSKSFFSQALLAQVMVALERQDSDFSPLFSLIEPSFFESVFF